MNLRSKILTNSLLIILIPILLTAAAVYFLLLKTFERRENEQREASFRESIAQVSARGRAIEDRVFLLAKTPSLLEMLEDRDTSDGVGSRIDSLKALFSDYLKNDRFSIGIELQDVNGTRIVAVNKGPGRKSFLDRNKTALGRTILAGRTQTPVVEIEKNEFATSFTHVVGSDPVLGFVIYTQDLRYFAEPLRNQVRDGVVVTCFDEVGNIWANLSAGSVKSLPSKSSSAPTAGQDITGSREIREYEGVEYYETNALLYNYTQHGAFAPLPGESWYVRLIELKQPQPGFKTFQMAFASIVFLTICGVYWISAVSAKRITEPIEKVSLATSKIARGVDDLDLDVSTGDEVEDLARAVRQMNSDLRDYQTRIVETARLTAMGEMTSEISHEIQNRISGVSLWLQHLDAEVEEDDERREYIEEMKLGLEGFLEMLSGLKEFYKKPVLEKQRFDLAELIGEAMFSVKEPASVKGVDVGFEPSDAVISLTGDREKLKGVVINLLINAIDASREGDKVSINLHNEANNVVVVVTDYGQGIKESDRHRVFFPFYTTKDSGSGLGLGIAKNVVEAHGGTIRVSESDGEGATFTLTLPKGE